MRIDKKFSAAVLTVALLGGVGVGAVAHETRTDDASPQASSTGPTATSAPTSTTSPSPRASTTRATPSSSPSPTTTSRVPLERMTVTPGAVGPLRTDISIDQARASGYFRYLEQGPCDGPALEWSKPYSSSLSVGADTTAGRVLSYGISKEYPRTRSGFGVGTTYAQLRDVADEGGDNDGGLATMYVRDGDDWIGFAFDVPSAQLTERSRVTYMEVSHGARPGLYSDAC